MVKQMICILCKHDKTEHESTKVFREDWAEHIFMDSLQYLESLV